MKVTYNSKIIDKFTEHNKNETCHFPIFGETLSFSRFLFYTFRAENLTRKCKAIGCMYVCMYSCRI